MNLSLDVSVPVITVFIQGLLSFFSPCVLPLIPVYIGYLSGGTREADESGGVHYNKKKVLINTFFFVIGISFAFFLLGFVMTSVGRFFSGNQIFFARIGGIIVILFGLYQLGVFGTSRFLSGEYRLPVKFERLTVSPITALVMGFVLSFAWTPCVGPALSSVLIMASTASDAGKGFLLIGVYTLGYVIPFLAVGLFTTQLLDYFREHKKIVKYTVRVGGVLMILMGIMMLTGSMNRITGYLASVSSSGESVNAETTADGVGMEGGTDGADMNSDTDDDTDDDTDVDYKGGAKEALSETTAEGDSEAGAAESASDDDPDDASEADAEYPPAPDFSLTDQYGNTHSLSDYKGKIVFLNFWATWCPHCSDELPYIQELYEEYSSDEASDVAILGVTFPGGGQELDKEGIKEYISEGGYTFPVLMDEEYTLAAPYYITSYPTTYIISPEGKVLGYIPGAMTKDIMLDVIDQAREISGLS